MITVLAAAAALVCGGHEHRHGVDEYAPVIRAAYQTKDWADADPRRPAERRQLRHFRHCARPGSEGRMRRVGNRVKSRFRAERAYQFGIRPPGPGYLAGLRACESHGDYGAHDASGTYHGAYQFDFQTWGSVGGVGDPHLASPRTQDLMAAKLWRARGSAPWPVCG